MTSAYKVTSKGCLIAAFAAVSLAGSGGVASAQSRSVDPRAYQANAMFAPAPFEPAGGTWRYGLMRPGGCRHSYPMSEQAGCGTASGGPAGGIN